MTAIVAGAREQASGLAEVNTAITQLDRITQQNASMIDGVTANGRSLSEQAVVLAERMTEFRVETGAAASGATALSRRRPPLAVA